MGRNVAKFVIFLVALVIIHTAIIPEWGIYYQLYGLFRFFIEFIALVILLAGWGVFSTFIDLGSVELLKSLGYEESKALRNSRFIAWIGHLSVVIAIFYTITVLVRSVMGFLYFPFGIEESIITFIWVIAVIVAALVVYNSIQIPEKIKLENELRETQSIVKALDERLAKGEINEETYKRLKTKYDQQLVAIREKMKIKTRIDAPNRCPACGTEVIAGTKFCHKCGEVILQ